MYIYFKRFMDIVISFTLLLILSPIMITIFILSKIFLGGNPIFKQKRIGFKEQEFEVIKFRTMTNKKDDEGNFLPDKDRLTRYGLVLRKLSLDELPQLINVLKGDMSLIGPRPLLVRYLPFYSDAERKRHTVRPGITGLAQINGRNNLEWDKRLALDIDYVDNISFKNDITIIFKTISKVLKRENVNENVNETMLDLDEERRSSVEG